MVQFIKYSVIAFLGFIVGWYSQYAFIVGDRQNHFIEDNVIGNHNNNSNTLNTKNVEFNQAKQAVTEMVLPDVIVKNKMSSRSLLISVNQLNEATSQRDYQSNILNQSEDVESRLAAIDVLTDILASEEVAIGLGDIEVAVRIKSIEGLKIIASDNSIRYIGQSLFTTNTVETKLAAINSLSELSYHPYAQEFLQFSSKNDSSSKVRKAAVSVLEGYPIEN